MSDTQTPLVTIGDDLELPAPGTFAIDPLHSHLGFSVRHMMISKVKGRFSAFSASLVVPDDPLESLLEVEVDLASVDTRDGQRDGHLRSSDFFDVERYPTMTFSSTGVYHDPGESENFQVIGDLTLHGVTRPLMLDATFDGLGIDMSGGERLGFEAMGEINREDFGLSWNQTLPTGGVLVGKQVRIEIEAEFVRQ
jgi:polyisoprenoid-binding protein YceI